MKFLKQEIVYLKLIEIKLKRCENETEDNNEKICSRFYESVFRKIDFTTVGHPNDHPVTVRINQVTFYL